MKIYLIGNEWTAEYEHIAFSSRANAEKRRQSLFLEWDERMRDEGFVNRVKDDDFYIMEFEVIDA